MNLSARIKSSKYKPDYVLNVNINIPIRQPNLQSYRPVSGEFTFSPSQRTKKLKLQIPSARTTNQCESRKQSYLGQTQNTMSYRNNNRKRTVKSAFPAQQIAQLFNATKKAKNQCRSQVVSPNRKKMGAKSSKLVSSNTISTKKQFISNLINESNDNIIGYTQSSELQRISNNNKDFKLKQEANRKLVVPFFNKKSESPVIQLQKGILKQIREFQKSAQEKKQHLNYQYLKEKVLVLASVKKIQRAWRNYKTKKLLKSYSNNISLKFTDKMKNQLIYGKDSDQMKILTVRSCGYSKGTNQFKKQGKKNLSNLYLKDEQIQQDMDKKVNSNLQIINQLKIKQQKIQKKAKGKKQNHGKSAIVKFQMQQIQKWQQLIKNIKQGKKVDQVLQKSFKRKQQLQKQLFNNLKDISLSQNSQLSIPKQKQLQNQFIPEQKQQVLKNQSLDQYQFKHTEILVPQQVSVSSESQMIVNNSIATSPNLLKKQQKQKPINFQTNIQFEEEQGATTQKRRKRLQYFQNQLRKIDNQYSESNLSQSYNSQLEYQPSTPQHVLFHHSDHIKDQRQENLKLKRKLQAINRIQMFNQQRIQSKQSEQEHKQSNFLYTALEFVQHKSIKIQQQRAQEIHRQQKMVLIIDKKQNKKQIARQIIQQNQKREYDNNTFFPLSINQISNQKSEEIQQIQDLDKLDTFRGRNLPQMDGINLYKIFQDQKQRKLKKRKLSSQQKYQLFQKVQQQIMYDLLLQFSEKQKFINRMELLFGHQKKKQAQFEKPQGICTNLESIKDYLQNFVAFTFQQQPNLLISGFNKPRNPTSENILKNFVNNRSIRQVYIQQPVLSLQLFNKHWQYASQQIYFDAKYPNDSIKQNERVQHLKSITKIYFRAIFDGFNESLQPYRIYGLQGKPFIWQPNIKTKIKNLQLSQIKPLIRLGYRKLSQVSVIYCGLLFEDKKHNMSPKMVQQIQKQRLDTLVELELEDFEHTWFEKGIQTTQIYLKISQYVKQFVLIQFCKQLFSINKVGNTILL